MVSKFVISAALAVLTLSNLSSGAALAGPPSPYAMGVALYNKGNYRGAQMELEAATRATPYDASSHYYLGLCYMQLKQTTSARQQFQWVAQNASDPTVRSYAASALTKLPGAGSVHAAGSGTAGSTNNNDSTSSRPTDFTASAAPAKKLGRCKAIMFETSWCHYCHEFAPHFDEVANRNRGSMDFERVDAEQNVGLKEKYGVHSYPRLVYLDGSGNVLYNEGRGAFDQRVQELTAK